MANNPFDQFDKNSEPTGNVGGNPFDQFTPSPTSNQAGAAPKQNTFWDTIDVINRNFANTGNGGLQIAAQALAYLGYDTASFQKNIAQQQAMHERDYQAAMLNSPIAGTLADVGSQIGAAVATPGSQPFIAGSLGLNAAGRLLGAAGASALAGGEKYVDDGSVQTRLENTANAGFIGGALQGGGDALVSGVGALAQKGAKKLFSTPVQEAADSFDNGLLTTPGGATGNKGLQAVEGTLGKIPVIGAGGRIGQEVGALKQQTSSVLDDLGVGVQSKVELGKELDSSIRSAYGKAKANTDTAYANALDIATKNQLAVPLSETQSVATNALQNIKEMTKSGLSSAGLTSKSGQLLQDLASLPEGKIPAKMFDSVRRRVNSTITNLSKGNDEDGLAEVFKQIRGSMDTDLDTLGGTNSQFGDALKKARATYLTEKKPFQDIGILDKSTKGQLDVDKLLDTVVQSDRPILTKNVMDNLSSEGKKTFSTAIIQKAFNNSLNKTGEGIEQLNLSKFTTNIHNMGETLDALPKNEQLKIKGLQRLLTRGEELIKAEKASPTNAASITSAITGAGLFAGSGLPALIASAGGTKLISTLMTSPKLTRNLIKLAGGRLADTAKDGVIRATIKKMLSPEIQEGIGIAAKRGVPMAISSALGDDE